MNYKISEGRKNIFKKWNETEHSFGSFLRKIVLS